MSLPARAAALIVAFLGVVAGAIYIVVHFLLAGPTTVDYSAGVTPNTGQVVNVVMQETAQTTVTNRPNWVSYFIQDPSTKQWVHTTLFSVPAGSTVHMTILGYDGCTPLRNPYWGKVTGTAGNVEYINGKPTAVLDTWSNCSVAHTFSIPAIGLNVPVASPTTYAQNTSLCSSSPCTSGPHTVVTFSFRTPSVPGSYFWQCRIPCGLAYLDGYGGPMQTLGYMTGEMKVVG